MPRSPERAALRRRLEIVRQLALTDFQLKYHDSALGYVWSMLSPLLMLVVFYVVFRFLIAAAAPGYLGYLAVGLVYWTFFQDCTFSGLTSLAAKADVLRSVGVAPVLVVTAAALSTVITVLINSAVLVAALAVAGRLSPLFPLVLLPLGCLVLLATGISFLLALAYARFRDTALIWTVLLQAGFWLTPVVYYIHSAELAELVYLNPVARCLYLLRWFLLYDYLPAGRFMALTAAGCAAVFAAGAALFVRRQRGIPEAL